MFNLILLKSEKKIKIMKYVLSNWFASLDSFLLVVFIVLIIIILFIYIFMMIL